MNAVLITHNMREAAKKHRALADQLDLLAGVVALMGRPDVPAPTDVVAQALKPFGIALVHTATLSQAINVLDTVEPDSGDEARLLQELIQRLQADKEATFPPDLLTTL